MALFVACFVFLVSAALAQSPLADLPIEQLADLQVRTAALHGQTLESAPASVTVITADQIRVFGYRTLGDVLSNTRGFHMTADGGFQFAGVRGFSIPGDYTTRFLVMIDGHPLGDNIYGAMYNFGEDFPISLAMVRRIEIVRGPTAALYGSNGLFATINVITKSPGGPTHSKVSVEGGSFGTQKVQAMLAGTLGKEAAVSIYSDASHASGRQVQFPGVTHPVDHVEAEDAFHVAASLKWKNWSVIAAGGEHKSIIPTGWYGATLGDTGTTDLESRNFIDAAWSRPTGVTGEFQWRFYYDQFRYDGVYEYRPADDHRNYDGALGDWTGSQFVYRGDAGRFGAVTLGIEGNIDLRNTQYGYDMVDRDGGTERRDLFRINWRNSRYAIFGQQEITVGSAWTVYAGLRFDDSRRDAPFLSPRVALVYNHSGTAYKLMYGTGFRNPSAYERCWEPNPGIQPERIGTVEFATERTMGSHLNWLASVFTYRLDDLIVGVPISDNVLRYDNSGSARVTGAESEVNVVADRFEASANFFGRTGGASFRGLRESPAYLAQFRAAARLLRGALTPASTVRVLGQRQDAAGGATPPAAVLDLTATVAGWQPGMELVFGVRNLLDAQYSDPLSPEHATSLLPRAGRAIFLKLTWRHESQR